jgi:PDZ domain-containing secreted protein
MSAFAALGALLGALATIPTSYWFLAPGNAVDLASRVRVEGYAFPQTRFYLTDVTVAPASPLILAFGRFLPGVKIVPQETLIPKGIAPKAYDRVLSEAMVESQDVGAVVAERAAGLHVVQPPTRVSIVAVLPQSKAGGLVRPGDVLLRIAGQRITTTADVTATVARLSASAVSIVLERGGVVTAVRVPTIVLPAGRRLGIIVETTTQKAQLPVPVRFSLDNISGSSGGLMIALQIYDSLRPQHLRAQRIAGTGTISYDGTVGAIEGTQQKLIAAKREGATIFLVPKENYADISSEHVVRVIPVHSFREALAALEE